MLEIVKSDSNCDSNAKTVDEEMFRGLITASSKPARSHDVRNFLMLHSPRVHGSAELLLQYESAYRQQCNYLQQSKNTWALFWSKSQSPKAEVSRCETRRMKKGYYWRPLQALQPVQCNTHHRACILHPRHTRESFSAWEEDVVKASPTLKSILKAHASQSAPQPATRRPVRLPPIEELDRHETDYEPIEYIAKRNKLNFNSYLSGVYRLNYNLLEPGNIDNYTDI